MKNRNELIEWLLLGDVAIQYQTQRDLQGQKDSKLQARIANEGWGARFLAQRQKNKHWGRAFYQPKWTSSHYTLLDLKNINIAADHPEIRESIALITHKNKAEDGGIYAGGSASQSDVCINGMYLNYACYFDTLEIELHSVVDFLLSSQLTDGGFNCHFNRKGASHSSMHTTLSILEGIHEYTRNGYQYRLKELLEAANGSRKFLLRHHLYKSDHSGEIIKKGFTMLSNPPRWRYNILRSLLYFASAKIPYDERLQDALDLLIGKRRADGTWPVQAKHAGEVHFDMEVTGQPSRWNTLYALIVLDHYQRS